MHQQEEFDGDQAYEDPHEEELFDDEGFWTLFEEEEEDQQMDEIEANSVVTFWGLLENKGKDECGSMILKETMNEVSTLKRTQVESAS